MASASGPKLSREEYKKAKELDEMRKAGTAAPELDEEGRMLNPHTWSVIQKTPWYLGMDKPTLKHQKNWKEKSFQNMDHWYKKGNEAVVAPTPTASGLVKFKKGSCENCGATTHKKIDCLERPRKTNAKKLQVQIAPDDVQQHELNLDFEGKRDRWNGYNPDDYSKVIADYQKVDMAKRMLKADRLQQEANSAVANEDEEAATRAAQAADGASDDAAAVSDAPGGTTTADGKPAAGDAASAAGTSDAHAIDSDSEDEQDEFRYGEDVAMPGQKFDPKKRISVRNLRIREDTAKYLYNLDVDSAYYDPKSRAMRDNPFADSGKDLNEVRFAGENMTRNSGDMSVMAKTQIYAWEAASHGADVHMQADPTRAELARRTFDVKKSELTTSQQSAILEKYGGAEHLEAPPKELLLAQSENYVEYSRSGKVLKGQEKAVPRSRYEEDVLVNNHTKIWGSYWEAGRWGYGCCQSFVKNSFCVGDAGILAKRREVRDATADAGSNAAAAAPTKTLVEQHLESRGNKRRHEESAEDLASNKAARLADAKRKLEQDDREAERLLAMDDRSRPYHSMRHSSSSAAPSEEELEAYRLRQVRSDDPMAQFASR